MKKHLILSVSFFWLAALSVVSPAVGADDSASAESQYETLAQNAMELQQEIEAYEGQTVEVATVNRLRLSRAVTLANMALLRLKMTTGGAARTEAKEHLREAIQLLGRLDPALFSPEDERLSAAAQSLTDLALLELADRQSSSYCCRKPRRKCCWLRIFRR
ncbi:MAG: hypothetical protein ACYTG0_03555 [Planctomycetota bacterium]|jgi:hypothetical protein